MVGDVLSVLSILRWTPAWHTFTSGGFAEHQTVHSPLSSFVNQTSFLRSNHCSGSTLLCISVHMWTVMFQKGPQGDHLYFPLKQLKYYSAINLTCMENFWKNGSAWIFKLLFIIALIITNCCRAKKAISKLFRHYSWQSKVAAEAIKPKLYLLFIEKLRNCFKNLFAFKETTRVQFQLP